MTVEYIQDDILEVQDDIPIRHARHRPFPSCPAPTFPVMLVPTFPVMPGPDRASFLLQRFGRVGAHHAEGLEDYCCQGN